MRYYTRTVQSCLAACLAGLGTERSAYTVYNRGRNPCAAKGSVSIYVCLFTYSGISSSELPTESFVQSAITVYFLAL